MIECCKSNAGCKRMLLEAKGFFWKGRRGFLDLQEKYFLSRSFVAILDFQVVVKVSTAEICELNKFNYLCYALIYFIF